MSLNEIVVIKYVNPHLFWIRELEDVHNLERIRRCLSKDLRKAISISAEANELVALEDSDGFKRAVVINVNNGYNCWLLDYGRSIVTNRVYKLPEELGAMLPTVKVACLDDIVGVRHRLNIETCKDEVEISPYFEAHAIQYIGDKLSQAKRIYFCKERRIGDIFCGSFILDLDGTKVNLADLLVQEGYAAVSKELFLDALAENCHKLPITAFYEDMSDCDNICSVEGIGRRLSRTKVPSAKKQRVNAWLENIKETSCAPDMDDRAREQDALLHISDVSDNSFSDVRQMVVSDTSTTNYSDTSRKSDEDSNGRKLGGRGKLLNKECTDHVNKENLGTSEQHPSKNEDIQDFKTLSSISSDEAKLSMKKHLKLSDILKLISNTDVKNKCEEKVETKSDAARKSKKHMSKLEILKALSNPTEASCKAEFKSSTDFSESSTDSSIIFDKNKSMLKETNFSSSSSNLSSLASDKQFVESESCNNSLRGVIMNNAPSCKCENCKKVFDDDLEEIPKKFTDDKKANDQFYRGKPQSLLKADLSKSDTLMVKKRDNKTKIEKDMAPNILIHGPGHLPTPISEICAVPFCFPVHKALRTMNYKTVRSMQMYMWPALMRSMNACIINGRSSGKTLCYLPALCSFLIQKEERYPFLPREPSPIAIILCHSIKKAEEVYDLLLTFLRNTCRKVDIALLVPPIEESILMLLKRAEIIVSTPKVFVRILTSRTINLKRLCHLVVEDIDEILDQAAVELYKIVKAAQSMLDHRIFVNSVQIIMTSEKWTISLEDFIKKLNVAPVICIGSHLESVIYGKANLEMHFVKKDEKNKRITTILKEYSKDLKTIIICNTDQEVLEVSDYFQVLGVSVIAVTQTMMREDVEEKEILWLSTPHKNNSVFVCTDVMLHTQLSITTAQILIHYSLPTDTWSLFARRFKCVIDTLDSPFNTKFNKAEAVKVHVFVDESCSKQFPRLYHFLQQMKTVLPQHFKNFCQNVENAEEAAKIEDQKPFCKHLKLLGKCTKFRCKKRHIFSPDIDKDEDVPRCGIIKFKLLHVADVTQFGIKVLEHWSTNREKQHLKDYTNLVTKDLRKCVVGNKLMAMNLDVGSLYVYLDAKEVTYHRCKVLKILSREKITNAPHEIKIKLIDDGIVKRALASLLFELSSEFLGIPPQSIEARLANVVPLEHDTEWNLRTKYKVETMINELIKKYHKSYFVGKIVLQVGGTVWLEDLIMREDIESSKETVTLLMLKQRLTKLDLIDINNIPLNNLRDICTKSGLNLPNYEMEPAKKEEPKHGTSIQIKPQWAYLDAQPDAYNVVYFSHAESPEKFFVKLEKYYDLYMDLEEEIQMALDKPFYPQIEELILGNCYLARDPGGDNYNRVILKEIKGNTAECFFADFGDTVDIPIDELKYLADEHISKLPFQAIECRLYGVKSVLDTWSSEATNIFYKFCYLPGTDIYRNLFVNVVDNEACDYGFKKYWVAMLDYIENKTTIINKILVDCGLAIDDKTAKLDDLVLPEFTIGDEQEIDDSMDNDEEKTIPAPSNVNFNEVIDSLINKHESLQNEEEILEDIDRNTMENDGWDFPCWAFKTFMAEISMNKPLKNTKQPIMSTKNDFVPMKALPSTSYCTPNVIWHQTKTHVFMMIQLQHVQDYSAIILRKKVFIFSTKHNNKDYMLNLSLFDTVNHLEKSNTGLCIKVTLTKVKNEEWLRLVDSKERTRNIKYDLNKIPDDEPPLRRFLDHGEGFDDGDDEDYPTIHNISSDEETDSSDEEYYDKHK